MNPLQDLIDEAAELQLTLAFGEVREDDTETFISKADFAASIFGSRSSRGHGCPRPFFTWANERCRKLFEGASDRKKQFRAPSVESGRICHLTVPPRLTGSCQNERDA